MNKFTFNEIFHDEPYEFAKTKGSQRVQINNILSGISVAIIAILMSNDTSTSRVSNWILIQLSGSIPLLITSSLFYTKTCYRGQNEYPYWNTLAGLTHSIGYFFIINAIVLIMFFQNYVAAAWVMLIFLLLLILVYSVVDYSLNRRRLFEKVIKFIAYILIIGIGSFPVVKTLF